MLPALYLTPQLHERFWELNKTHRFNGTEQTLYWYLVRKWAEFGGKQAFWHNESQMCEALGDCAVNTMKRARKHLADAGLIEFVAGGKSYGDKTMYTLTLAPSISTDSRERGASHVTENGVLVVADEAHGLKLMVSHSGGQQCENRYQLTPSTYQNFDTLNTSSPSQEKKTVKKEDTSSSQATLFQEERPTPPSAEEIYAHVKALMQHEQGEALSTIDLETINTVAAKFIAAKAGSDWRDDASQKCMIGFWKERLARYYHAAKWGTRAEIQKAYNAMQAAKAQEQAAKERADYIARKQAQEAAELAEKARRTAQQLEFDATVQNAILTKVETNAITLVNRTNHGNTRPKPANKNRSNPRNVATANSESIDAFVARKLAEARAKEAVLRAT